MRKPAAQSWRNVDKRMRKAVKMREQGLSNREIARRLAVGEATIRRDLERYASESVEEFLRHTPASYGPSGPGMAHPYDAR